jgi:hypothetical protein
VPLFAQEAQVPDVVDVHLRAMNPEYFFDPALAKFGAHRKTYKTNERDPEALLRRTLPKWTRTTFLAE